MYHRDDKRELKIDVYKSGLQITYSQPTDTVTDVSPRSVSRVRQGRHHNELSACKEIRYRWLHRQRCRCNRLSCHCVAVAPVGTDAVAAIATVATWSGLGLFNDVVLTTIRRESGLDNLRSRPDLCRSS